MFDKKWFLIIGGVIVAGLLAWFLLSIAINNTGISKEENVRNAAANIKAQEKARIDKVANLVDVVLEYSDYEQKTLLLIVQARTQDGTIDDYGGAERNIKVIVEAYPELKVNQLYQTLMLELITIENRIFEYRQIYNDNFRDYTRFCHQVPGTWFGWDKKFVDFGYLDFDAPSDAPKDLFKK